MDVRHRSSGSGHHRPSRGLRGHGTRRGHGPHEGAAFPGHGTHDLLGLVAFGQQRSIPLAAADRCLPADGLEHCGELRQAQWPVPTDVGRSPGLLGPVAQGPARLGRAGLGPAPLRAPRPPRICRGRQPPILQALAGVIDARQVAQCRPGRHRDGALDAPSGLEGREPGSAAPVGRAPGGPTRSAEVGPSPAGVETPRRGLQLTPGICTHPAEVAEGFIGDGGALDGGEVPRAQEPGELQGVLTGGGITIPSLKPGSERFFYHSFPPRRGTDASDEAEKGFAILRLLKEIV